MDLTSVLGALVSDVNIFMKDLFFLYAKRKKIDYKNKK